jgi:flagellar hook-associated protein 2
LGLRFDPMGGGQFQQAIKQIVEAERQPIKQLETRKSREEAKMKLFQDFKAKFQGFDRTLAEFTNFRNFVEMKAELGDGTSLVDIQIDKNRAQPGTYKIEIEQLAQRPSIMTSRHASPDEANLGVGFIVARDAKGEKHEVYVAENQASLRGIASAINAQPGMPIQASVVKDDSDPAAPWRLIITGKGEGGEADVEIPDFYFLDGEDDIYIDEDQRAETALLKLDGFEIESLGNKIPDFLQGVNLNLKQARPGQPFTLTISEDNQKIAGKIKGMVDQINGILEFINKQNQVDDKSDTRTTFAGDTSLQTIEYRLRNILHEGFPVGNPDDEDTFRFLRLNEIGVEFNKSGLLELKEDKFKSALEKDFRGVSEAITGPNGFASQLRFVMNQYTTPGSGQLALKENAMRSRIRRIDEDIANKERTLERRTQSLVERFSRLQSTLSGMQQQQAYMQSQMGAGGGNLMQQLMGG